MKKLSKLSLNKEKITALNSAQMNYLRGGGVTQPDGSTKPGSTQPANWPASENWINEDDPDDSIYCGGTLPDVTVIVTKPRK